MKPPAKRYRPARPAPTCERCFRSTISAWETRSQTWRVFDEVPAPDPTDDVWARWQTWSDGSSTLRTEWLPLDSAPLPGGQRRRLHEASCPGDPRAAIRAEHAALASHVDHSRRLLSRIDDDPRIGEFAKAELRREALAAREVLKEMVKVK